MSKRVDLGDAVYAEMQGQRLLLGTLGGCKICLERDTYEALAEYVRAKSDWPGWTQTKVYEPQNL